MQNKILNKISKKIGNPPTYFNVLMIFVLVILVAAYLWQINTTTILGKQLTELETKIQSAQNYNKELQLSVAEEQSIVNLQDRLSDMPLAQVDNLEYIELGSVEMVAKR